MAAPKKVKDEVAEAQAPEAVEAPAPAAPKDVKVFSLRQGKVDMGDDGVLQYRKSLLVTKEKAEWLLASFPGSIEIV